MAKYIMWTKEEKEDIIMEAKRILDQDPKMLMSSALKMAQKRVILEDRQRDINSVNVPQFNWFTDGIKQINFPESLPIPLVIPANEIKGMDQVATEVAPVASNPMDAINTAMDLLRDSLKDALTSKPEPQVIKLPEPKLSGEDREIFKQLGQLIVNGLKNINQFHEETRKELASQKKLLDTVYQSLCNTLQIVNAIQREFAYVLRGIPPTPTNGISSEVKEIKKPRVIILGFDTGHWIGHINSIVATKCQKVEYIKNPGEPRSFTGWDFVIATKKVPLDWIATVKQNNIIDKERLVVCDGGADSIAKCVLKVVEGFK